MASLGLAKEVHKITVLVSSATQCTVRQQRNHVQGVRMYKTATECLFQPVQSSNTMTALDVMEHLLRVMFVCIISNLITIMRNHHYPHLAEIPSVRENMRANTEQRSKKLFRSSSDFFLYQEDKWFFFFKDHILQCVISKTSRYLFTHQVILPIMLCFCLGVRYRLRKVKEGCECPRQNLQIMPKEECVFNDASFLDACKGNGRIGKWLRICAWTTCLNACALY